MNCIRTNRAQPVQFFLYRANFALIKINQAVAKRLKKAKMCIREKLLSMDRGGRPLRAACVCVKSIDLRLLKLCRGRGWVIDQSVGVYCICG